MASFTINGGTQFPEGTSVGAYLRSQWPVEGIKGAPSGSAVATATVTSGVAAFTGLADATRYVAYAQVGGADRYDRFQTDAAAAGGGTVADGSITDAKIVAGGLAPASIAGTAVIAADSRLADTRTPTDATVTNAKVAANAAIVQSKLAVGTWTPTSTNLLAATFDPLLLSGSSSPDAADTQHFMRMKVPEQITVTNLVIYVNTAATLTANHCWGSVYKSDGTLIAKTADQSGAGAWLATGIRAMALTAEAGQSLTIAAGWVYASLQFAGTTFTVGRAVSPLTAALLNYNLAAVDGYRAATGPAGVTTPAATVPTLTINAKPFWAALT